jgi:hypothetical protein
MASAVSDPQKLKDKSTCCWHGVFSVPQDYILYGLPPHTTNECNLLLKTFSHNCKLLFSLEKTHQEYFD